MARVYISIGSNIDRAHHVRAALDALARDFSPLTVSRVFESEAVNFVSANFYNLVVGCDTDWPVEQLYHRLRAIEADNGRVRDNSGLSARTLDLDLLLYDDLICQQPTVLPRRDIDCFAFVLQPLAEIAPEACHPVTRQRFTELWQQFSASEQSQSQRQWPVKLDWQPETTDNNQ